MYGADRDVVERTNKEIGATYKVRVHVANLDKIHSRPFWEVNTAGGITISWGKTMVAAPDPQKLAEQTLVVTVAFVVPGTGLHARLLTGWIKPTEQ